MSRIAVRRAVDLSIPLDPRGAQPNAYDAPSACAEPFAGEGFLLNVARGGSCNCDVLHLIPHCNGTHTESVGHLTREPFPLSAVPLPMFMGCAVISVQLRGLEIHADDITRATATIPPEFLHALVVRTLPNDTSKRTRRWEADGSPFFTVDAMHAVREKAVNHLLVDMPSVDPLYDGGRLAAHRVFWSMPPDSREIPIAEAQNRTITELIFVPDDVPDGCYRLTIQTPHIVSDAVPSRPILFYLEGES